MTLGEYINTYCHEHNISMREFAKMSGVSHAYISMIVNGKTPRGNAPTPSIDKYKAIASAMGITLDQLLRAVNDNVSLSDSEAEYPEITMIARAGKKMSPERRADMLQMLKIAFPEAFKDD